MTHTFSIQLLETKIKKLKLPKKNIQEISSIKQIPQKQTKNRKPDLKKLS